MADEPAVPEAPVTPAGTPETPAAAPAGAPAEAQTETPEEIDWKQRYEDLRPEADRRASLLADIEGRNGLERQAQALAEHARIELEEEQEEPEEEDEFDIPDPMEEIQKVKQELARRDEAAQIEEVNRREHEYTERTVESLESKEGIELTDEEYDLVVNYGLSHRDEHDGKPDFEGAFAALKSSQQAAQKRYTDSKMQSVLAPVGATGEPKHDLRDKDARQKVGIEVFEAAERAKET